MKYRRTTWVAALILLAGAVAFAADIRTDYDHGADFSAIHTYSWGKVTTANPFYVDRIKRSVDQALQAHGWQMVSSGGDATIFATDRVKNEQQLETMYEGMGGGWGGGWAGMGGGWGGMGFGRMGMGGMGDATTSTIDQRVGVLVIDIFQSGSKKLMWRGSVKADLSDSSSKNSKKLDQNIGKLFSKAPFKKEKA